MHLEDAVCVVTGASGGIGNAIAFALGRRGAQLAICARTGSKIDSAVRELRRLGVTVWGATCDVSDQRQVERFAGEVHSRLGPVDVLVNIVGLSSAPAADDGKQRPLDRPSALEVPDLFRTTEAFLPDMQAKQEGTIVSVASLAGNAPVQSVAAYAASRRAVLAVSAALRREVRKYNVRVVLIFPGTAVTEVFDEHNHQIRHPGQKLHLDDVAHIAVAVIEGAGRKMTDELDIQPSN